MTIVHKGRLFSVLLPALTLLVGWHAGATFSGGPDALQASTAVSDQPAFATFQEAWDLVQEHYVLPDEIDETELIYGATRGMMEALGDTGHSGFLDPVDAAAFRASLVGELIGIGIYLEFDGDYPSIVEPVSGSPAELAGLETGDLITEIDGVATDRMTRTDIGTALRGLVGEEVTLTIGRPSTGEVIRVTLVRARISISPVEWAFLPGNLMLLRLNQFSAGAGESLREALELAANFQVEGIVFDLRGNPGGYVTEALRVAGEFLPEGVILYQNQQRDGETKAIFTEGTDGLWLEQPLVVLIDRDSASAAEIVAASLFENGRAELVGERTFGTGTVVSSFDLDDGSVAAIGTALWLTPNGELVRNAGVEPSIPVQLAPGIHAMHFEPGELLSKEEIETSGDRQLLEALSAVATTTTGLEES